MTATGTNTTLGAALMVGCMALIGLVDNYVVVIAKEVGLWQFHLVRSLMVCGILAVLAPVGGWTIWPKRWRGVLIRSAFGGISMAIWFGALAFLPIAQVGAGLFTAPIFVMIFSALFFGAAIGPMRVVAALVGFAGVLLVLQLDLGALSLVTILPMLAGVTWAMTAISTREYCEGEGTVPLLFWFFAALGVIGSVGLVLMGPLGLGTGEDFVRTGWVAASSTFWFWVSIHAAGSVVAIGMLTRAYQVGEVSYIAIFEYSFLIFASFWAWVIWGDVLNFWAFVGIALIIGSGAVIALRTKA